MPPRLRMLARSLINFVAGGCLLCDQACTAEDLPGLCTFCRDALPFNRDPCERCAVPLTGHRTSHAAPRLCVRCANAPPPFTRTVAPLLYLGQPQRWIGRLKSHAGLVEGRLLGQVLARAALHAVAVGQMPRPDVVLPVPLARLRLARRGHNQAVSLAIPVARHLRVPLARHGARRTRRTVAQRGLGRAARLANLRHAFASRRWEGERVAIVDDVMTTGATAAALAATLLDAGADEVLVLCATRTPEPPR